MVVPGALAGRNAAVIGVERPPGRAIAVALAEAGANVAVITLSTATGAEFEANSTVNEFWAIGVNGVALGSDGSEATVKGAIAAAAGELGPVSILVCNVPAPLPRDAIAGLRSDPAIVVVVPAGTPAEDGRALFAWTRELADAGLRANALVEPAVLAAIGPALKEHRPPESLDLVGAAVYLVSDSSAAVEGAVVAAKAAERPDR
jgi:NAD(P)-dependent dehydrogenase (short-subunit alcohol dehydrogenase family)